MTGDNFIEIEAYHPRRAEARALSRLFSDLNHDDDRRWSSNTEKREQLQKQDD